MEGAIAGVDTWDAAVFEYAKKLKGIARFGIGIDNFNLEDMKKIRDPRLQHAGHQQEFRGGARGDAAAFHRARRSQTE